MPYGKCKRLSVTMKSVAILIVCSGMFTGTALSQEAAKPSSGTQSNTVIGCLSGPDSDDHYTLTNMQHRSGIDVVGSAELQKGTGAKVKLTGSWEAVPGSEGKKGDSARRFKATEVTVMEERCEPPAPVTPVSKKKQAAQKQAQQAQPK